MMGKVITIPKLSPDKKLKENSQLYLFVINRWIHSIPMHFRHFQILTGRQIP